MFVKIYVAGWCRFRRPASVTATTILPRRRTTMKYLIQIYTGEAAIEVRPVVER
jgi:hypothetical protein